MGGGLQFCLWVVLCYQDSTTFTAGKTFGYPLPIPPCHLAIGLLHIGTEINIGLLNALGFELVQLPMFVHCHLWIFCKDKDVIIVNQYHIIVCTAASDPNIRISLFGLLARRRQTI
jgi:hypothetical protein